MRSEWPTEFSAAAIDAARDALSNVGVSTQVTVRAAKDAGFDETEGGTAFIDCEAPPGSYRSYPELTDAIDDASGLKRTLVDWIGWPWRPGVMVAENGATLTNAARARIRLCQDGDQHLDMRYSLVDGGVPTVYVFTESGLLKAARVIGKELTMSPIRQRARGVGEVAGELALATFSLLGLLGACATAVAAVYGFGLLLGLW